MPRFVANDRYRVRLHFSENVHNGPGLRKFNVTINGVQVLTNFDIYATAGGMNRALVVEFLTNADANGKILVQFTTGTADVPQVNGIEGIPLATLPEAEWYYPRFMRAVRP